jgi:hypothetical protein
MEMAPTERWPFDPNCAELPVTPGCVEWGDVVLAEPELAAAVRARLDATKHHVLATLRSDGAPRVSGTEVIFHGDVLAIGSMWHAVKALDLLRDGRFALHSNPGDGSMEGGDAKVSGVAVALGGSLASSIDATLHTEAPQAVAERYQLFRLDVAQVVLSEVDHERECMVIRSWWPERGLVTAER